MYGQEIVAMIRTKENPYRRLCFDLDNAHMGAIGIAAPWAGKRAYRDAAICYLQTYYDMKARREAQGRL